MSKKTPARNEHIGYWTIRLTVAEWTRPPLVPVIVTTWVPAATLFQVAIVSTEVPELTTDAGVKVTVARRGAPLWESVTVPENPPTAVIVTV